ncbi:MAG TPA: helix-turn-helix transcriptional regulator [Pseudonocardiaceae bacterium]|jgi:transcriptional regulator with XRE-family HTH domain|nr:helix-turn-helix transcriptional regulator [Pseudonocardiaceae bacterium]
MAVLLREAIGDRLRHARTTQHRTLREVSRAARVSLGYLSEVERGRKEASSELLAAICDALELPLADLLHLVATDVSAIDVHTVDDVKVPATTVPARPSDDEPSAAAMASLEAGLPGSLQGGRMVPAVVGTDLADLRLQPMLSHRLTTSITPRAGGVTVAA